MRQKTEQQNLELLEQYFRAGCKREDEKKIGVELEHFVTERQTGRDISYYGAEGVGALLEEWKNQYPVKYHENGSLIGLACREYALSLEPAAQLEISISPQKELREIPKIYRKFLNTVGSSLDRRGYELLTTGYRRSAKADDLEMIPKRRYEYMDQYFRTSGSTGRMMMRGTASAQISVDYSSEDDFVRKYRALSVVMPMIKLLTDNTPVVEGRVWKGYLARTWIWHHVDPGRCGILPGVFGQNFGFRKLAEYLWNLKPVFRTVNGGTVPTGQKKVKELWADCLLTEKEIEHIISMTFPDIRVKRYLELRGADSMPISCVTAYAALVRGLTSNEQTEEEILERYPSDEQTIQKAEISLMKKGFEGEIYNERADVFAARLLRMAAAGLSAEEQKFLEPFYDMTERKKTVKEFYAEKERDYN